MGPEDDTTTTSGFGVSFFSQPVKIKYHAVAKSTRKCLSLTCSVVRMLDGQVKDKSVRNLM